jgi:hypothetical protein
MIVKDGMRQNFICISLQFTLRAVAEKMIQEAVE